jgi:putative aldouronate transport system permease protein
MFIPCLVFYVVFRYGPMYGIIIAFKKYNVYQGIIKSPWVGFKYFEQFFRSKDFFLLMRNTVLLGLYHFLWTFPCPIIFAILLNEIKAEKFKKTVQTVSYLPSFLSIVIIVSMVIDMLSPGQGIINRMLVFFGLEKQYFMIKPKWFRTIYIASDIWAGTGFGSIIYLSALSSIDQNLYEAGKVDGCNRFNAIMHITLPSLFPTIATMFIIRAGNIFRIGYEKVLLMYNPMTYEVADIFSTYVYRKGLLESNYSYATAVGLFESVIALIMLVSANALSKKLSESSLW